MSSKLRLVSQIFFWAGAIGLWADGVAADAPSQARPLWTIPTPSSRDEVLFGDVRDVLRLDSGEVFVLDRQLASVRRVSADGKRIEPVGRAGEGPGEFVYPTALVAFPPGRVSVVQARPPKLAMLGLESLPPEDWVPELPEDAVGASITRAKARGSLLVLQLHFTESEGGEIRESTALVAYHAPSSRPHRIQSRSVVSSPAGEQTEFSPLDELSVWTIDSEGRVLIADRIHEVRVGVYSERGGLLREDSWIAYEPLRRSPERRQRIEHRLNAMAALVSDAGRVQVDAFDRAVQSIHPLDDGGYLLRTARDRFEASTRGILRFTAVTPRGEIAGGVALPIGWNEDCDLFWLRGGFVFVGRYFQSARRAALQAGPLADAILGEDRCEGGRDEQPYLECRPLSP